MRHPSGVVVAASGLRMRPRDMARFGWMMHEEGRVGGTVIVPADYARASLTRQIETDGSLTPAYGYQWWIESSPDGSDRPLAIGYGGQRIALVRTADMVIVVTAGEYGSPNQGAGPRSAIEAVVRAVETDR